MDIHIIDQSAQYNDDVSKMVAGLWHQVTFTQLQNLDDIYTLTMYQGTSVPTNKNVTNYYKWKYTPLTTDPWKITSTYGNETIDPTKCNISTDGITFCIGIPDYLPKGIFYHEIWTMELSNTDGILYTGSFDLEKPTRGFAKSHGDYISFSIDPFTIMQADASDYITLKNTGNVPLNVSINYKALDDFLFYTESHNQIPADQKQDYRLSIDSLSWKPQRIQQEGTATAIVSSYYLLDEDISGTAISLQTALVIDVPAINIFVGHNSYELTTLDEQTGFSFQHQKRISMTEGEIKTVNAYVSGDGTATISIQTNDNISVLDFMRNDQTATPPFTIISTNEEEQTISIQIKALSENRDGLITYTVQTDSGTNTFTTYIDVGPPATKNERSLLGGTSTITIIVLLALILVAGYMLYNHLSHNRRKR